MQTKLSISVILWVLVTCGQAYPVGDKTFTSSGQILPGEEWNNVSIYNDTTVVDMLGGFVDSMGTHDASRLNVFDGYVNTLDALESSGVDVSGGDVHGLHAWNHALVNFSGDASAVTMGARNAGIVTMSGGTADYVGAIDSGVLNLYGGVVGEALSLVDSSVANIFGYDLLKTDSGGKYGYGQVTGFWLDHTGFAIDLNGAETYDHVNLIPEPSSVLFLAGGLLMVRRKTRSRSSLM
ncbi:MAG: hypothetical protein ACYTEL_23200 [Planctomycetota bacterium]|jgi:hypothetical protein